MLYVEMETLGRKNVQEKSPSLPIMLLKNSQVFKIWSNLTKKLINKNTQRMKGNIKH